MANIALINNNIIVNIADIDESEYEFWEGYFTSNGYDAAVMLDTLVKYNDGNQQTLWMGWHRREDGTWYDPNWVPPEIPPEEPEEI